MKERHESEEWRQRETFSFFEKGKTAQHKTLRDTIQEDVDRRNVTEDALGQGRREKDGEDGGKVGTRRS